MLPDRTTALVLALNPSIDAEWQVDMVHWEEKNSIRFERRWAGGKGINVARWLRYLGEKPRLLLPLGSQTGRELARGLLTEKISAKVLRLSQPTRVNVVVTTASGRQLRFNPPGPELSRREWNGVVAAVAQGLKNARLLILSGSLPRGVPVNAYAQLIRLARRAGVETLLDCDGEAFAAGVKARPFLVKPNEHELAQWWRRPLGSESEITRAARALAGVTRGWVLVSRGSKKVLLLNQEARLSFVARPLRVAVRNTVGAGDALLAAVARQILHEAPAHEWLAPALATAAAATRCAPGKLPAS